MGGVVLGGGGTTVSTSSQPVFQYIEAHYMCMVTYDYFVSVRQGGGCKVLAVTVPLEEMGKCGFSKMFPKTRHSLDTFLAV